MLCFFQWFVRRVSRKVGLLKRRVRRSCAQRRNQKLHAAVAKSTFWSQNAKKLTVSEHFLKFRCRKNARCCGEKHILQVKMLQNMTVFGALLSVQMSKNCTPLWRKAHFESQNVKKLYVCRSTFWRSAVEKLHWRCGETHIWKSKCAKHDGSFGALFVCSDVEKLHAAVAKSTLWKSKCYKTLSVFGALLDVLMSKN